MRGQAGFAGTGGAGNQNAAAPVVDFAAQHGVQPQDTGGYSFGRCLVIKAEGGDRHHREALPVNQKRVFVGAVGGTPVFDNPQTARGNLLADGVVEENDAVGDIFLQSEAGEGAFPLFAGNDGGDTFVFEEAEQAAQFRAQDGLIR